MKKKKKAKFLNSLFLFFLSFNLFTLGIASEANATTITNPGNLVACKESTGFEKRLNISVKKFENRLKLYQENTPEFEFLKKEIALTNARFDSFKNSSLLCGKDGLPHIITNGDLKHFNEFALPALVFLYITGWIGWAGRKYLQYSHAQENAYEKEIVIDVPTAFFISISGFLWPIEAWKEFLAGKLIVIDDDITISPR